MPKYQIPDFFTEMVMNIFEYCKLVKLKPFQRRNVTIILFGIKLEQLSLYVYLDIVSGKGILVFLRIIFDALFNMMYQAGQRR